MQRAREVDRTGRSPLTSVRPRSPARPGSPGEARSGDGQAGGQQQDQADRQVNERRAQPGLAAGRPAAPRPARKAEAGQRQTQRQQYGRDDPAGGRIAANVTWTSSRTAGTIRTAVTTANSTAEPDGGCVHRLRGTPGRDRRPPAPCSSARCRRAPRWAPRRRAARSDTPDRAPGPGSHPSRRTTGRDCREVVAGIRRGITGRGRVRVGGPLLGQPEGAARALVDPRVVGAGGGAPVRR